jgi:hypothetical protein
MSAASRRRVFTSRVVAGHACAGRGVASRDIAGRNIAGRDDSRATVTSDTAVVGAVDSE